MVLCIELFLPGACSEEKQAARLASSSVLPGVWVLGEGSKAAGVHVSSYIDVHGSVGLGELGWERNSLSSQRRNRGPC